MNDLPYALIANDRDELLDMATISAERFDITLVFGGTGVKLVRLAFAAGQTMREHSTNAPLVVQVLEGEVVFRVAGESLRLVTGALVHVRPGEVHEVEARTDAHLLLTIAS
jgi:quercetin dioxygenase-like cupin family protein